MIEFIFKPLFRVLERWWFKFWGEGLAYPAGLLILPLIPWAVWAFFMWYFLG